MCITKNTLIGVADGRNAVSLRQLIEEGCSFPVYCYSHQEKRIVVRKALYSRLTRNRASIVKVTLDDGTFLRTTLDHQFMLKNGTHCEAEDLQPNIRLMPFHSFIKDEGKGKHYRNIQRNNGYHRRQYRMSWEFYYGEIRRGYHLHHKDFDQNNDAVENLEMLSAAQHIALHRERMLGENNPAHQYNDTWRQNVSKATSGKNNPRWMDISNEELIRLGKQFRSLTGKPLTLKMWNEYAEKLGVPELKGKNFRFGTFDHFLELCGLEKVDIRKLRRIKRVNVPCCICGREVEVKANDRRLQGHTGISCSKLCGYVLSGKKGSKTRKGRPSVNKGNVSFKARMKEVSNTPEQRTKRALAGRQKAINLVRKICDFLSKHQIVPTVENWEKSASAFKQETGSFHFIHAEKAAELLGGWHEIEKLITRQNHRVVSVETDGFEEVYTLIVEECHNYAIITRVDGNDMKTADLSGILLSSGG